MTGTQHDIVVFGATSFVGQILARYLADQFGGGDSLRWALAGRSRSKLDKLRHSLGGTESERPLIVADAADDNALREMCMQTRVVISTVGPYALYGEPLVAVCAETGTDYCDLTGEVQWIRRMIDGHEDAAIASGARIVHCCGFDSIPSDLGVLFLQRESQRRFGHPCETVAMRVKAMRGGFSGGTAASLMNVVKEASHDSRLRKLLANPYSLCPTGHEFSVRQPDTQGARYDSQFDTWIAPFVMSGINTRVVHRSNALANGAYGSGFRYDEAMMTGSGVSGGARALGLAAGLGGFVLGSALPPTRWLLERVMPAPGEGPSPEEQQNGFFDLRFRGQTADGEVLWAKVTGDRDPGYGSTAKMLGQAGACLAQDLAKADRRGGMWTPATALGERLVARLEADAGLAFELLER